MHDMLETLSFSITCRIHRYSARWLNKFIVERPNCSLRDYAGMGRYVDSMRNYGVGSIDRMRTSAQLSVSTNRC